MAIEVNGVTLPDIPSDVLEQYPYAFIAYTKVSLATTYALFMTATPCYYVPQAISATLGRDYDCIGCLSVGGAAASHVEVPTEWDIQIDTTTQIFSQMPPIVWSNYDILTITSVDFSTGEYTTGDIYFARNDVTYDEEYIVKSAFLIAMADKARELSGANTRITTDEITAIFDTITNGEEEVF